MEENSRVKRVGRWTKEEELFLKENYPIRGGRYCANFLGRKLKYVHSKAKKLGIRVVLEKHFNFKNRVGEVFTIRDGYKAEIIKYEGVKSITVKLSDGTIIENVSYGNLKIGSLINPNHRSVYGVGFMGQGVYTSQENNGLSKAYDRWHSLLRRSYWEGYHASDKSYKDVTVCEDWHNFQNFAKWFYENYNPEIMQDWQLDKDIICSECKIYSPETCCFVPSEINKFFCKSVNKSTNLPVGVNMNGTGFKAEVNIGGKTIHKTFRKLEDAVNFYKTEKEKYAKKVAEKWKNIVSDIVYDKLINYKVKQNGSS